MQIGEQETFISELLNDLTLTIQDLETHQIHMFYEAVGLMIGADANPDKQRHYLVCILLMSCAVLLSMSCHLRSVNAMRTNVSRTKLPYCWRLTSCFTQQSEDALPVALLSVGPTPAAKYAEPVIVWLDLTAHVQCSSVSIFAVAALYCECSNQHVCAVPMKHHNKNVACFSQPTRLIACVAEC